MDWTYEIEYGDTPSDYGLVDIQTESIILGTGTITSYNYIYRPPGSGSPYTGLTLPPELIPLTPFVLFDELIIT